MKREDGSGKRETNANLEMRIAKRALRPQQASEYQDPINRWQMEAATWKMEEGSKGKAESENANRETVIRVSKRKG